MTTTPAGWYPDPDNQAQLRWWDGAQWTEHRSAPPVAHSAAPYATSNAELKAPEGTKWNTVWIWILVVLPYLSSFGIFTIDWSQAFDFSHPSNMGSLSLLTSPGYLANLALSWIAWGLFVWFSYLDWRELSRRGVPKPFHWAWGFLTIVYTIGRSVVVRRRTGAGISPMWVTIVIYVVYVISTMIYLGMVMWMVLGQIPQLTGTLSP